MKRTIIVKQRRVEYTLICARQRQNVLLQALPDDKIRVYAPSSAHLRDIDRLVRERLSWIDEMHSQLRLAEEARQLGDTVLLEGKRVPLVVHASARPRVALENGALHLYTAEETAEARALQVKHFLNHLALTRIRAALDAWAPTVGLPYGRVAIREQRTRWGSCSSKHNLNFNWKLIMAPPEALNYVVIHELCHLRDFNHSPRFWQAVRERMPDYEVWRKWLKDHGKDLVFP